VHAETSRAHSECDDRLAQRDDDDQPVPLREVSGLDAPALGAAQHQAAVIDQQRRDPTECPPSSRKDSRKDEETRSRQDRTGKTSDGRAKQRIIAREDAVGADMERAHKEVSEAKQERVLAKGVRDRHRCEEKRDHCRQQDDACRPLVGTSRVPEPGIRRPGEPQDHQDGERFQKPQPTWIAIEERCHLRNREHENEVEEQLERRNALLALDRCFQQRRDCQPVEHDEMSYHAGRVSAMGGSQPGSAPRRRSATGFMLLRVSRSAGLRVLQDALGARLSQRRAATSMP
jgi:hypothetical protein